MCVVHQSPQPFTVCNLKDFSLNLVSDTWALSNRLCHNSLVDLESTSISPQHWILFDLSSWGLTLLEIWPWQESFSEIRTGIVLLWRFTAVLIIPQPQNPILSHLLPPLFFLSSSCFQCAPLCSAVNELLVSPCFGLTLLQLSLLLPLHCQRCHSDIAVALPVASIFMLPNWLTQLKVFKITHIILLSLTQNQGWQCCTVPVRQLTN